MAMRPRPTPCAADTIAALRRGALIDAMPDLAQLSRQPLHLTEVDLSALGHVLARELQTVEAGRQVSFRIAAGPHARGDRRLPRVVLASLSADARKFTSRRADACIEPGSATSDGGVSFHVCDNGAGFDVRHVDQLFACVARLHDAGEFPAPGIGLAMMQHIVQRHVGHVRAGATFHFSLP